MTRLKNVAPSSFSGLTLDHALLLRMECPFRLKVLVSGMLTGPSIMVRVSKTALGRRPVGGSRRTGSQDMQVHLVAASSFLGSHLTAVICKRKYNGRCHP
mmetsp:Transcript_40358/g.68839  ORF Transcript_40358/g.68839 Transcript_40358/m.68839 type:complete len:100 (+) Transcript_40358:1407-1706(+)